MESFQRTILISTLFFLLFNACKEKENGSAKGDQEEEDPKKKVDSLATTPSCDSTKIFEVEKPILAYSDRISYFPGDSMELHVHSKKDNYRIRTIYHQKEKTAQDQATVRSNGAERTYNGCSYKEGFDWERSAVHELPEDLRSGYYTLELSNELGSFHLPFLVKNKDPEEAEVLVLSSTNTWHAYNPSGKASFYRYNLDDSPDRERANFVSFQRPLTCYSGDTYQGGKFDAELAISHWLDEKGIPYHVVSDLDYHEKQYSAEDYKVLILNTHPEYWSKPMYDHLEEYLDQGGNLMYLGGNGIYWKVTIKGEQMECRKSRNDHVHDGSDGGKWRHVGRHEANILGVAYTGAGANTSVPYIVVDPDHWVFENTGVEKGELMGKSLNRGWASGHETDKPVYDPQHTPENAVLLAEGLNKQRKSKLGDPDADIDGGAHMMYYEHEGGGAVFSAGSINYGGSLMVDSTMEQLTYNVLRRLLNEEEASKEP